MWPTINVFAGTSCHGTAAVALGGRTPSSANVQRMVTGLHMGASLADPMVVRPRHSVMAAGWRLTLTECPCLVVRPKIPRQ